MKVLLDTHLLLWAAQESVKLRRPARDVINDPENELYFSAASIWEIAIKHSKRLPDFEAEPAEFRASLLEQLYFELPVSGTHAAMVANLPPIHRNGCESPAHT